MRTTPIPPMTKEMWTRYWAACSGLKKGAPCRVSWKDEKVRPHNITFNGEFIGVTPLGELTFHLKKYGVELDVPFNDSTKVQQVGRSFIND